MDLLWQMFSPRRLETFAQVASAVFVGVALLKDARTRELDVFMRLDERWNTLGEQRRLEGADWPDEKQIAWGWQLLSFGELVASMINGRRLRNWRLRLHFKAALELVQEWLDDRRFETARNDPQRLPEFKLLRLREKGVRRSWRQWLIDRLR